jgi:Carboxypeptidase regulatory-like domain
MLRAGVLAVLAAGCILTATGPAQAAEIENIDGVTLRAGSNATITVRINNLEHPVDNEITIGITGLPSGVGCSNGCGKVTVPDTDTSVTKLLTLQASGGAPAANVNATVTVDAKTPDTRNFSLRVEAAPPPAPQNVKEVSGKVTDSATGGGIEDAVVGIQDSQGHVYMTNTDGDGRFRFVSSSTKPIVPGEILITAEKEDYKVSPKHLNGSAGQTLRTTLAMTSTKAAEPTATPEATDEALPSTDAAASDAASVDAENLAGADNDSGGGSTFSWLLIALGGLLVSLGVGAIVLLLVRRKDDDGDEEGDDMPAYPRRPVPTPASRGMYRGAPGADPTRVVNQAGMGAAPTMVARPPMADAQTMMHRPPADPYPDPYGAPLPPAQPTAPQPPTYGAAQPGWGGPGQPTAAQPPYGSPPGAAYGSPTAPGGAYGAPTTPGTYGSPAAPGSGYANPPADGPYGSPAQGGGYGAPPRTGAHGGPATSGGGYGGPATRPGGESYADRDYAAPASPGYAGGHDYAAPPEQGYGAAGGGYSAGHGSPSGGYDDGGYDARREGHGQGGYQQPADGGYGSPSGGYDDGGYGARREGHGQGGYEQGDGGYDERPRYDRVPEPRRAYEPGGYDQGGYDQEESGGNHSRHSAGQQPSRSERRSLDWLDD